MFYICFKEICSGQQGVGIGGYIKVQCAAYKIPYGIGSGKLVAGCRVAANSIQHYSAGRAQEFFFLHIIGLFVVEKRQVVGAAHQRVELGMGMEVFIGDVYYPVHRFEVNIDPVTVIRFPVIENGILLDNAICRVFKRIREPGPVEQLVLMAGRGI